MGVDGVGDVHLVGPESSLCCVLHDGEGVGDPSVIMVLRMVGGVGWVMLLCVLVRVQHWGG